MLLEPNRTPYDLNFRLFGVPVRVHPLFWILSAALGWSAIDLGIEYVLVWVACVFVSILVHEFGHVWAWHLCGSPAYVVLYSFGGLAIGSHQPRSHWQRIFISLAGPGVQLLLYGAVRVAVGQLIATGNLATLHPLVLEALDDLLWINWAWALMNLLPIWPLDGGQVSRELFQWRLGGRGLRASLLLSIVVAGVIALNSLSGHLRGPTIPYVYTGGVYGAIMFGLLAVQSYLTLQQVGRPQVMRSSCDADDRMPWERDADWWKQGSGPYDR